MTKFSRIVVLFTLLAPLSGATAQQTDSLLPRRGAWGAEMLPFSSGGSILKFTSPRRAWLLGLTLNTAHMDRAASGLDLGVDANNSYVSAQLGHRWYLASGGDDVSSHLRPTLGLGVIGTVARADNRDQFDHQWGAGAYGEAGVTWFFTPHFSLGAVAQLQAGATRWRQSGLSFPDGTTPVQTIQETHSWSVSLSVARALAAVYF